MDELDLTEKTPRAFETGPIPPVTMPIERIDIEPLTTERAADGTRSRLPTAPPPLPVRVTRVSKPPPIPTAAFEKAEPEPEIPMTIAPVVTRRAGTIPPPIPSVAMRRPPTVPPVDAPSIVIAPMPATPDDATDVASPWPDVSPSAAVAPAPAPVEPPLAVRSPRESAAVATLPEWPILAQAPVVAAPVAATLPPLPALPAPASEWLHPKVATPPLVREDPEVASTKYYERTGAPPTGVNKRYIAAAGVGGLALIAIVAFAMRDGGDTKTVKTEPARRTHTHAITKAPAIATAAPVAKPTATSTTDVAATTNAPAGHALAEVPISSWPQGATVTLVDDGTAKIIGRTPVTASLDPARSYDVVLAVSGRPTTVRHLDPTTTHELAVDLDSEPAAPAKHEHTAKHVAVAEPAAPKHVGVAEPAAPKHVAVAAPTTTTSAKHVATATPAMSANRAAAAPVTTTKHVAAAAPAKPATAPAKATPAPTKTTPAKPTQVAKLAPVDFDSPSTGTLQIQSKPPCEIVIDGKPTHLTTPQRAIALTPGTHAVTLINVHDKLKKTVAVHIEAKRATKLAHDFTSAQ